MNAQQPVPTDYEVDHALDLQITAGGPNAERAIMFRRYIQHMRTRVEDDRATRPSDLDLLELLTAAVAEKYSDDPSKPSVVCSRISTSEYYVSIVRYRRQYGEAKEMVSNCKAPTIREAIVNLSKTWMGTGDARQKLKKLLERLDP